MYSFELEANYFTILYWFCLTSTWILHRCTRVPHPEPPSHLPPHTVPLGHPSAPAPSILYHALNLDASLLFNMLSKFVIDFLLRSKHLLISWLQTLYTVILEPKKIDCHCFHFSLIYLPWSDGTRYYDLSFLNVEFFFF